MPDTVHKNRYEIIERFRLRIWIRTNYYAVFFSVTQTGLNATYVVIIIVGAVTTGMILSMVSSMSNNFTVLFCNYLCFGINILLATLF